jgi:hypothetical protein
MQYGYWDTLMELFLQLAVLFTAAPGSEREVAPFSYNMGKCSSETKKRATPCEIELIGSQRTSFRRSGMGVGRLMCGRHDADDDCENNTL